MDSASNTIGLSQYFRIDGWTFHNQIGRLERKGQAPIKLEPRVSKLLTYLCNHAGIPLTRETLIDEVWPGMVVGDEALSNTVNKLRKAFGDDRQNPRIVETLPKIGYRLIATVKPVDDGVVSADHEGGTSGKMRLPRSWIRPAGILLVVLALFLVYWFLSSVDRQPEAPDRPSSTSGAWEQNEAELSPGMPPRPVNSIAVLPFENLNRDPEQDYFSDGMTDDLITDLSNISDLAVIARNSVFAYKGRPIKAQQIAKELGATHILYGSIRRAGSRIRINAQFIDGKTGLHIWAERYDRNLENVFELQDEITERIITALKIELSEQEKSDLEKRYTNNIAAYDVFLQGQQAFLKFTREGNSKARALFRKATELDPEFARAYANYGWTFARDFQDGWTKAPEQSLSTALELALKAKSLDPTSSRVHWILGQVYLYKREYEKAIENVRKAIKLSPNNPDLKILLARILAYSGNPEESIALINEAMRINPFYPMQYQMNLGIAQFANGEYQRAIDALIKAMERNPDAQRVRMWLVASYANAGDLDAAQWEYDELLTINPDFSVDTLKLSIPFRDEAIRDRLFSGLRLASEQ